MSVVVEVEEGIQLIFFIVEIEDIVEIIEEDHIYLLFPGIGSLELFVV